MEYVQLGKSDLKVSKLCLGCMSFGNPSEKWPWALSQEETDNMIKKALELGINFLILLIYTVMVKVKHLSAILLKSL